MTKGGDEAHSLLEMGCALFVAPMGKSGKQRQDFEQNDGHARSSGIDRDSPTFDLLRKLRMV
jgi:hypothetical protein